MTPYHDAFINGFEEAVKKLKKMHGVIVQVNVAYKLCQAGAKGDIEKLKYLKDHGASLDTADYNLRTALHLATCEGHLECV